MSISFHDNALVRIAHVSLRWVALPAAILVLGGGVVALRLLFAAKVGDPAPRDETAALVQNWMRHSVPAAHVSACHAAGARDPDSADAPIWACRLWYVTPSRSAVLCVSLGEHVVHRQIGAGDPAAPSRAGCQGRSDAPDPPLDGSY